MRSQQELPYVSVDQRAAVQFLKRIRKLRWIGREEEARRVVRSSLRVWSNETLAAVPSERR
jgi:hypothetical protein